VRVPRPPLIDGLLDDAVWAAAPASSAFTEKFPNDGRAPVETTTMRIVYDDDALYIAFECKQTKAKVVDRLTRRDRVVESDWVSFAVDTRHDGKSAFEFIVNAGGALIDGLRFNDTDYSADWDENWEARTAKSKAGWTAEIRIPFRILRFDSEPVQSWGMEARRYVSERQETDEWAFIPRSMAGEVSHYGRLDGLAGIHPSTSLELRPFVVGKMQRRDAGTGALANGVDFTGSAGLDLKWHLTQGLTLDSAINPDFAQVEADQVVLNLTNVETYYPEKRQFFLEGVDTFATPLQLVYTRRVGRNVAAPTMRTSAPFSEQLVDVPTPGTIYTATKLTGRLADRWTIGTLQAITAPNNVAVQLGDGTQQKRLVDPLTNFGVLRLRRDLGTNAHIGFLGTAVTRAEPSGRYPLNDGTAPGGQLCPDGTTTPTGARCFSDAYVAAIDWRWRSPSGDYVTGGQVVGSELQRGPPRAVPDGTLIQPGDLGKGLFTYVAKEGGKPWLWYSDFTYNDRKLDYNDLGFNRSANAFWEYANLEYRTLEPHWKTLETHTRAEVWVGNDIRGLNIGQGTGIIHSGKLANFWRYSTEIYYRPDHFDNREVGDGTALQRRALYGTDVSISSDTTKLVSFSIHARPQHVLDGINVYADAGVLFRVLPALDLELLPMLTYNHGEPRYVGGGPAPGQLLFGRLDAKSVGATLRATYTFVPRLTLQTYAQLFLASGHYDDFSQFQIDPNVERPAIRVNALRPAFAPLTNPDFAQGVLNVNVVLRWEYRLGSLFYLVYTRAQTPSVSLIPGERGTLDLGAVRKAPATDVILVKFSYWWG
ncbi:MAG: DUF5916 domain-containing protein, partial [Polyangiaceae bacterium]